MKKIFMIAVMVMLLFTGCQPKAESPAVMQKDMEQMIQTAASGQNTSETLPLRKRIDVPERYVYEHKNGNLRIVVDAPITVPDVTNIPVIRAKFADFTQAQVDACWRELVGDTVMYEAKQEQTKAELAAYIQWLKENMGTPARKEIQHIDQEQLEISERLYKTAPEHIDDVICDGKLKQFEQQNPRTGDFLANYTGLDAISLKDSRLGLSFTVENNSDQEKTIPLGGQTSGTMPKRTCAMIDFTKGQWYAFNMDIPRVYVNEHTVLDGKVKECLKITPAEAKRLVESLLKATGTPMTIYSIDLVDDAMLGNREDGSISPAKNYAYRVMCARNIDGSLLAPIFGFAEIGGNPAIAEHAYYEQLYFIVNDDGIITMKWYAPITLEETIVQDSQLLPFSSIQATFEKMMDVVYAEWIPEGLYGVVFSISDVRLELFRVLENNSITNGILIPVWRFYGITTRTPKDAQNAAGSGSEGCIMTINAIDGSVVDVQKGY